MALILIVEDEKLLRWALTEQLKRVGHSVHDAADLAAAREHLDDHQPDVLLLDISLPDGNGLDFFQRNLRRLEDTVVIVMTAVGQVEEAVRAMKLGAIDFLGKPVDQADLVKLIEKSLTIRSEHLEVQAARQTREREIQVDIVSESDAFNRVLEVINEVAQSDIDTILIEGESGTGKNVLARHIHALSDRHKKQILEISCAALPDTLIESELLGHERGAFTDAKETRKGAFELVDGGTVVLDEIGELKLELQAKMLHVLEERKLRRVGGSREIQVNVRVIGLTNRDLASMVREGTFRQDLFYRLSIFPIRVPPLRERMEDILPLANHFLETLQPKMGRKFKGFSRESENLMLSYSWPGNVREIRNVVERAMILEKSPWIEPTALVLNELGMDPVGAGGSTTGAEAPIVPLEEMERQLVTRAMAAASDNQTRAAELLGVTRDQLRYRLKKFNLGA